MMEKKTHFVIKYARELAHLEIFKAIHLSKREVDING
jgi:hypothetical protein